MRYKAKRWVLAFAGLMLCVLTLSIGAGSEPTLKIGYYNLSFSDSIYIKYAVETDIKNTVLLVWTHPDSFRKGTEDYVLSSSETQTIGGKSHAIYNFKKLAAKQMGDVVYARAYAEVDGVPVYSEVKKYSILQYAYNMLGYTGTGTSDGNLRLLLEDMLLYGAEAQLYFGYNTDRLVTENFFRLDVVNGHLDDDLMTSGLYLSDDVIVVTASAQNAKGEVFSHWSDEQGDKISKDPTYTFTMGWGNRTVTAVYTMPESPDLDGTLGIEEDGETRFGPVHVG